MTIVAITEILPGFHIKPGRGTAEETPPIPNYNTQFSPKKVLASPPKI